MSVEFSCCRMDAGRVQCQAVSTTSKSWVIVAVLAIIADAEQYFSTDSAMARSLLPYMIERGWGRIIFILSESGLNIPTEMVHYGMTRQPNLPSLAASPRAWPGVTVNAVLPGPTRSEGAIEFIEKIARERRMDVKEAETEVIRTLRPTSLLKRMATPEEVADLVVYL